MYDIIIVGAGGFGREVYQWALAAFDKSQYQIKGFLAQHSNELDGFGIDAKILGHENNYIIQPNDRFIIAIGNISIKERVVKELQQKGAIFLSLIHPTSIVLPTARIGEGVVVCPYSIVSDNVVIGDFAMLNVYVYCGHDSSVGKYSILSPYATLNGGAVLGDRVFMATHTMVAAEKNIGDDCIIGANSVVLHNIPSDSKVIGVSRKCDNTKL